MAKSLKCYDEFEFRQFTGKSEFDKGLTTLLGIINGISADGKITDDEAMEIANWITLHEELKRYKPFDELVPLAQAALTDGYVDEGELEDIIWVLTQYQDGGKFYNLNTLTMQILQGILHGILADGEINDVEIINLKEWLDANNMLKGTYPYDELQSMISGILEDKHISDSEKKQLSAFIGEFIDCTKSYNISKVDLDALKKEYDIGGLCSLNPEIIVSNHTFCFTGKSSKATRSEIEKIVVAHNGIFIDSVNKKTEYLIVGDEGNPCWSFSCYGRKVEKAMEMRKSGSSILIVHENDFWSIV